MQSEYLPIMYFLYSFKNVKVENMGYPIPLDIFLESVWGFLFLHKESTYVGLFQDNCEYMGIVVPCVSLDCEFWANPICLAL